MGEEQTMPARIDRLAPYRHRPRQITIGDLRSRPEGRCVGCQEAITNLSNVNPIDAILHDGSLVCHFCLLQLMQAEQYGWHPAGTQDEINWNPWPPDDEQLSFVWNGRTFYDYRWAYQGPRRSHSGEPDAPTTRRTS
jgi:hypothetical protein